eukprot:scaffold127258_cov15-Tisochrysis_lutea.AAC.1
MAYLQLGLRLWSDNCDVACPPKVQSGGKYNFQTSPAQQPLLEDKCPLPAKSGILSCVNYPSILPVVLHPCRLYSGSDDNFLHSGAIVVALGTRYSFYCAYLSRTFLIDPTKKQ